MGGANMNYTRLTTADLYEEYALALDELAGETRNTAAYQRIMRRLEAIDRELTYRAAVAPAQIPA
jgi:hypothetical protein